jgi:hypothetical protein
MRSPSPLSDPVAPPRCAKAKAVAGINAMATIDLINFYPFRTFTVEPLIRSHASTAAAGFGFRSQVNISGKSSKMAAVNSNLSAHSGNFLRHPDSRNQFQAGKSCQRPQGAVAGANYETCNDRRDRGPHADSGK